MRRRLTAAAAAAADATHTDDDDDDDDNDDDDDDDNDDNHDDGHGDDDCGCGLHCRISLLAAMGERYRAEAQYSSESLAAEKRQAKHRTAHVEQLLEAALQAQDNAESEAAAVARDFAHTKENVAEVQAEAAAAAHERYRAEQEGVLQNEMEALNPPPELSEMEAIGALCFCISCVSCAFVSCVCIARVVVACFLCSQTRASRLSSLLLVELVALGHGQLTDRVSLLCVCVCVSVPTMTTTTTTNSLARVASLQAVGDPGLADDGRFPTAVARRTP